MRGWVWLLPCAALVMVGCGGNSDPASPGAMAGGAGKSGTPSKPDGSGESGAAGATDTPDDTRPRPCTDSYAACSCGEDLEGYEQCNADGEPECDCDAPIARGPLKACLSPCGGDVRGDWLLTDICGPSYAQGNCEHPVYDSEGTPEESGLSFDDAGRVVGNLSYQGTLHARLDDVCVRRSGGASVDSTSCQLFEDKLRSGFETPSACTFQDGTCDCATDLNQNASVDASYEADDKAHTLTIGSTTFDYCAKKDTLSFRSSADDFTFTYQRARITLPFEGVAVGEIENESIPPLGFELNTGDCKTSATLDTDALTVSCNGDRVRAVKFGPDESSVFFLRRLTVPAGSKLTIVGNRPAVIVAETIDVQGSISFQRKGTDALGAGNSGADSHAGGGGHCTAGGASIGSSSQVAGGDAFGSQDELQCGGTGGDAIDTYVSDDIGLGGRGGGAVALLASLSINVDGSINVNGRDGLETNGGYGAGGGAGGMIVCQAPLVTVGKAAKLSALGGHGGGKDRSGGGPGGDGRIAIQTGSGATKIPSSALQPSLGDCATITPLTTK